MSTGHDSGSPEHSGGYDPFGHRSGHVEDPYRSGSDGTAPYAADPYASDLNGGDPYATDPFAGDPYASDPYATAPSASDPYATAPHASAPPAQPPVGPYPAGPPRFGDFRAPLPSSGAAITGFVLGLVGLVMCGGLTSPFGIWFSARGMKETALTSREPMSGRGLAIAGLVISLVGLIPLFFLLLYVAVMIFGMVMAITA